MSFHSVGYVPMLFFGTLLARLFFRKIVNTGPRGLRIVVAIRGQLNYLQVRRRGAGLMGHRRVELSSAKLRFDMFLEKKRNRFAELF
jgi:hypothetical protein